MIFSKDEIHDEEEKLPSFESIVNGEDEDEEEEVWFFYFDLVFCFYLHLQWLFGFGFLLPLGSGVLFNLNLVKTWKICSVCLCFW